MLPPVHGCRGERARVRMNFHFAHMLDPEAPAPLTPDEDCLTGHARGGREPESAASGLSVFVSAWPQGRLRVGHGVSVGHPALEHG